MARTRHGSLAEQLSAVRAYLNRPVGVDEGMPLTNGEASEPEIGTNWRVVPTGEMPACETVDFSFERSWRMSPSLGRIFQQVDAGDVERDEAGRVVRIGALQFSDGTQTEPAYRYTIDGKLEKYSARMPVGAMLHCRDKPEAQLGGEANPQEVTDSNRHFEVMFGVRHRAHRPAGRKRGGAGMTRDEAARFLAEAYAAADMSKVAFTKCPDGLPTGTQRISDNFLGMKKAAATGGESMQWQDIATSKVDRDIWAAAIAALSDADRATIEGAQKAGTLADLAQGGHRRTRERSGLRRLVAANDNLQRELQKNAA